MKTLKVLRITSILNGILCLFCVASIVCFAINHFFDIRSLFSIGIILSYGWIINPVGIVSFVVCLSLFLTERKSQEAKQVIGKAWIWIFVWPVITTVVYLIAGVLLVRITGGI